MAAVEAEVGAEADVAAGADVAAEADVAAGAEVGTGVVAVPHAARATSTQASTSSNGVRTNGL